MAVLTQTEILSQFGRSAVSRGLRAVSATSGLGDKLACSDRALSSAVQMHETPFKKSETSL